MAGNVGSDRWRDWVMLALGAWLFVSPWILGFTVGIPVEGAEMAAGFTAAAWNAWIVGVVIAGLALWAALKFAEWHDWANGVLGVWLVVSPWILGFPALTAAVWNHVVVGLLVVALAAWELWDMRHQPARRTA
jgi:hypothetical protein